MPNNFHMIYQEMNKLKRALNPQEIARHGNKARPLWITDA